MEANREELNTLIKQGIIDVIESHGVWGIRSFELKDKSLQVICHKGKFLGGGISDNRYQVLSNDQELINTKNITEAIDLFYTELVKGA